MFSEQYIKLCTQPEVADRLREEWEPKCGDWVLCWNGDNERWGDEPWLVLSWYAEDALDVMLPDGVGGPVLLNEVIPLFQPRQLWRMLEERGYKDWGLFAWAGEGWEETDMLDEGYYCTVYTLDEDGDPALLNYFGPDAATALLRAWLEV